MREVLFETLRSPQVSSKCLDNQDERDAITEEILQRMMRFTYKLEKTIPTGPIRHIGTGDIGNPWSK
jgi:hypothetical protein